MAIKTIYKMNIAKVLLKEKFIALNIYIFHIQGMLLPSLPILEQGKIQSSALNYDLAQI